MKELRNYSIKVEVSLGTMYLIDIDNTYSPSQIFHRLDGPAWESNISKRQDEYYINGSKYTKIEYLNHPDVVSYIFRSIVDKDDRRLGEACLDI